MVAYLSLDLEEMIRAKDFVALREMLQDWSPPDLAGLIKGLAVEDQVVVFRILPRKLAAETFEFLSLGAQARLLKAMGQEEVAAILNDMAPDDRTVLQE